MKRRAIDNFLPLLVKASKEGDLKMVQVLLAEGTDPNTEYDGVTSLFVASRNGHIEIALLLLEKGAEIDRICVGETALFAAAEKGHTSVVKALIKAGANINALCNECTPLYIACQNGYTEIVFDLLEAGANIETTFKGCTPLFIASRNGHTFTACLLIIAGSNKNIIILESFKQEIKDILNDSNMMVVKAKEYIANIKKLDRDTEPEEFESLSGLDKAVNIRNEFAERLVKQGPRRNQEAEL